MMSGITCRITACAAGLLLCALTTAFAQQQQSGVVVGIVVDAGSGQPVAGAQIYVVGGNIGVITNAQGRYRIPAVPAGTRTLGAQIIGYNTVRRAVTVTAGQTVTVNFSIQQEAVELEQLVVTGVSGGATQKAKVPFTVSRVDASQMPVQAVNPLSQLQGRVAGANIQSSSGRPGSAPAVILRGPTSINASGRGQEPLYVVDGVILGSSLADINPADIQSVEVVKGAAASTLYGSRAAAGVIAITTKRGQAASGGVMEGVRFTARSEYGRNDIERDFGIAKNNPFLFDETGTRFCVLDGYTNANVCTRTIDYHAEQLRVNNATGDFALTPPSFPVDPGSTLSGDQTRRVIIANTYPGKNYNAVKQLVDPKPLAINDFSMSGRMGQTNFFSSFGYTTQGGAIMGLKGYRRLNGRLNLGQKIGDQWSVDLNSYISRSSADGANQEDGGGGFFRLTRSPAVADITARDQFKRLYIRTNLGNGGVQNENPLYSFENVQREDVRWRYLVGGTVKYTPIKLLEGNANFSVDRLNANAFQFNNRGYRTTASNPATNQGSVSNSTSNSQSLNASGGVMLRPDLLPQVKNTFKLSWNYEQQEGDYRGISGNYLKVADVTAGANATANQSIGSSKTQTRQMSYSAGGSFDVLDKYELDLAVRRDGSSRFGAHHRWQTYQRASGSWLMAREKWFPLKSLTTFTLRGSYGTAGNVPSYSAQYETYSIGSGGALSQSTLGNPDLSPEVVTEIEFGGMLEFRNRYLLDISHSNALAKDQILPVPVSVSTGFPTQWKNAGSMRSKTWEGELTIPVLRNSKGLSWTARATYARNSSVVEKLNVQPFFIGPNQQGATQMIRIGEGERYGTIYGRKFMRSCNELPGAFKNDCGGATSSFQKNDEGWIVWVGAGNNPKMGITNNLWNAVLPASQAPYGVQAAWGMPILNRDSATASPSILPLGHALPDYRLATSHTLTYHKASIYGMLEGAFGQSVWNEGRHWSYLDFLSHDVDQAHKSVGDAKPIGYYYRAGPGPGGNNSGIGGFYDILGPNNRMVEDASFLKLREVSVSYDVGRVGFGTWTVSLIGRNLKTWTSYSGFDPETGQSGGDASSSLINAVDAFQFPQLRSVSLMLSASF